MSSVIFKPAIPVAADPRLRPLGNWDVRIGVDNYLFRLSDMLDI
jgi:hypothetical protein